jgi:hypothetical protein
MKIVGYFSGHQCIHPMSKDTLLLFPNEGIFLFRIVLEKPAE